MTNYFSNIPLWSLILWGIFALLISIYYYRPRKWLKEISTSKRWILTSLRFLGLFVLGILLIGILIKSTTLETDQPSIITIYDNSGSMLNYEDSLIVKDQVSKFSNEIESKFSGRFNTLSYTLDDLIKNIDSLSFNNEKSNLSEAIDRVYNNYYGRNIGAVVLLSDGNYNRGVSPVYVTEKFKNIPFYTLGVGDTIQKVDHLISNVVGNEIAFLNNQFPIEVTVEGNLSNKQSFNISLFDNGKKIETKGLTHQDSNYSLIKTKFLVDARSTGVHHYVVKIESIDGEKNIQNNEKSIYVEVLDDRSNVLLLAEGLHPDIGAIKNALNKEQNIEMTSKLIKYLPDDLSNYDLIIWHNPGISRENKAFDRLMGLNKPFWYIVGTRTKQNTIEQLGIASNVQTTGQSDKVGIAYNEFFKLFELSKETRSNFSIFPPLTMNYGKIQINNSSNILGYQKVGAITKKDPLYYFGKKGSQKFGVTYGTGLWSWKLADYQKNSNNDAFNEIISKTIQYLIIKENTSRLRVKLPTLFNADENILVNATFYNKSYEPVTTPSISFELINEEDKKIDYSFLSGDQNYSLDLGRLKPGRYEWIAKCDFNGESFKKEGSFVVKKLELESINTKANHSLLSQIAVNSNGSFHYLSDYSNLINEIDKSNDIIPVSYETSSYKKLIDYFWWFVLLVALFGAEWLLRRYHGGY
jgi:hypothetical protein